MDVGGGRELCQQGVFARPLWHAFAIDDSILDLEYISRLFPASVDQELDPRYVGVLI